MTDKPSNSHLPTPRQLFQKTVVISDLTERERQLKALSGDDKALFEKVQRLLHARERATCGILARAVGELDPGRRTLSDASVSPDSHFDEGDSLTGPITKFDFTSTHNARNARNREQDIGPYRIVKLLGEGGMGSVYLAHQQEPVKREVAIKVIRPEVSSPRVIKRFEAERQILAIMDHPNIAKIFDAGTTHEGQPFFVMEFVSGTPITEYVASASVSLKDRLQLFINLCLAIEHAHQKGAIHRDLKPANVLVSQQGDEAAIVKVIDFGVAKALSEDLVDDGPATHFSQLIGTPLYMPPEQMRMQENGVDTRGDVYSLGVILYELIAGETPYDRQQLRDRGLSGFLQLVETNDPPPPSKKIKQHFRKVQEQGEQAGSTYHLEPKQAPFNSLRQARRYRELDWIVMKAIQANRDQRYASAKDLAADLTRFLNHKAVAAGPPTKFYSLTKWWDRNHFKALNVAVMLLLSISIMSLALWDRDQITSNERPSPSIETSMQDWRELASFQQALNAFENAELERLYGILKKHSHDSKNIGSSQSSNLGTLQSILLNAAIPQPEAIIPQSESFQAVAFSSQAARVVIVDRNNQLHIYNWLKDTGLREEIVLPANPDRIDAVAISPDGTRAVTGSFTGHLWFWDLDQRKVTREIFVADAGIETVIWSEDGRYVAAGARYELTWVADSAGNELFRIENNHRHESLLFANDCQSLFVPTREGISEFSLPDGKLVREITAEPFETVRKMCLGGNENQWLIAAERFAEAAMIIDIKSGRTLGFATLEGKYPQHLSTTGDGTWLSAVYPDRKVQLIRLLQSSEQTVQGKNYLSFPTVRDPVTLADNARIGAVWLESQSKLLIVGGDNSAQTWAWSDLMPATVLKPPNDLAAVFPTAENDLLHLYRDKEIFQGRPIPVGIDHQIDKPLGDPVPFKIQVGSTRWNSGFSAVFGEGVARILNSISGETLAEIETGIEGEIRIDLSNFDGSALAVSNGMQIGVWVTKDGWVTHQQSGVIQARTDGDILLCDEGDTLFCEREKHLCEYDVASGELLNSYDLSSYPMISAMCLDHSQQKLALGVRTAILIWDRQQTKVQQVFNCGSEITSLCYLKDGRVLLSGHRDGAIRAWHIATKQPLGILFQRSVAGNIEAIQLFPNQKQIFARARTPNGFAPIILGRP